LQAVRHCLAGAWPEVLWLIKKEQLKSALADLDVFIREDDVGKVFYVMGMDDNKDWLYLEEFKKAILVSEIIVYQDTRIYQN
jgi:hypothetical protein